MNRLEEDGMLWTKVRRCLDSRVGLNTSFAPLPNSLNVARYNISMRVQRAVRASTRPEGNLNRHDSSQL